MQISDDSKLGICNTCSGDYSYYSVLKRGMKWDTFSPSIYKAYEKLCFIRKKRRHI